MKMPSGYTDMSANELEYDGGFSWGKFGEVALYAGIGLAIAGLAGASVGSILSSEASANAIICYYGSAIAKAGTGVLIGGGVVASAGGSAMLVDRSRQQ